MRGKSGYEKLVQLAPTSAIPSQTSRSQSEDHNIHAATQLPKSPLNQWRNARLHAPRPSLDLQFCSMQRSVTFLWEVTGRLLTILGPRFLPARADFVPPERGRWASLASKAEGLADLVAGCCCCKVIPGHKITLQVHHVGKPN
eukprot:351457-Chlamydomonas_euryale.AAC.5